MSVTETSVDAIESVLSVLSVGWLEATIVLELSSWPLVDDSEVTDEISVDAIDSVLCVLSVRWLEAKVMLMLCSWLSVEDSEVTDELVTERLVCSVLADSVDANVLTIVDASGGSLG